MPDISAPSASLDAVSAGNRGKKHSSDLTSSVWPARAAGFCPRGAYPGTSPRVGINRSSALAGAPALGFLHPSHPERPPFVSGRCTKAGVKHDFLISAARMWLFVSVMSGTPSHPPLQGSSHQGPGREGGRVNGGSCYLPTTATRLHKRARLLFVCKRDSQGTYGRS